jgi:hypothetical protein
MFDTGSDGEEWRDVGVRCSTACFLDLVSEVRVSGIDGITLDEWDIEFFFDF